MDTRRGDHRPGAVPLQARPVRREGHAPGARDARTGAEAAMSSCATMTGPARQMCYAGHGVYV
ncbi:hypothetical protein ABZ926_34140 [Streptomyces litmocidini]|uniref:Uncharacterized protein n=1 Tax=Streptomyces litmocidini TaxID=67318 RepID=A0ABW7ULC9_9ACTN|nr:hypothetical protein [Streptomyces sp. PanSC19]ROQ33468.1 hypothetical protein EDD98_2496 [Streptomyces sp. PanSC19]